MRGFNTCTSMNSNRKYGRGGFTWYDSLSSVQMYNTDARHGLCDTRISCLGCLVLNSTYRDGPSSSIVIHPPDLHLRFLFTAQRP
jgi:hypothetical protein